MGVEHDTKATDMMGPGRLTPKKSCCYDTVFCWRQTGELRDAVLVTDVQLDELLSETWFMCVGLCCGDDNAEAQDHKVEIKEMPVEQQVREICSLAV
jgi:hypothetical protein